MDDQNNSNVNMEPKSIKNQKLIVALLILVIISTTAISIFLAFKKIKIDAPANSLTSSSTPYCVLHNCYPEIDITKSVTTQDKSLNKFSDAKYGFQFAYPKEWTINAYEYIQTGTKSISLSYPVGKDQAIKSLPPSYSNWDEESKSLEVQTKGMTVSLRFEIDKNRNPNKLPIRDWFNKEFDNGKNFSSAPTINQDVKISGVDAVKVAVPDMGTQVIHFVAKGTDIIQIIYTQSEKYDSIYNQIISSFKLFERPDISYELRRFDVSFGDPNYYDASLIQIDKSGNETVLISSIKDAVPELQSRSNFTLGQLSFPNKSNILYFKSYYSETDFHAVDIFSFDIESKKFTKLPIATKYYASFAEKSISPNGKYIATIQNPDDLKDRQKIFLIDLEGDTVRTILSLPSNESITFCSPKSECWGYSNDGNLKWIDDKTLEYAVYDPSKLIGDEFEIGYPLIEKRRIVIN